MSDSEVPGRLRSPTMAEVAAHLGLSRQTVSLVMRDVAGPSQETRRRVRDAATELGYRPHLGAQALRRSLSIDIGVVFSPAHATAPEMLEAIYPAAAEHGCGVIASPRTATRSTHDAVAELLGHRCSALIIIGSELGDRALATLVAGVDVPVVHVGHGRAEDGYDVVRSRGEEGVAVVVDHLVALGHRHIVYVHTPTLRPTRVRRSGYARAVRRHRIMSDIEVGRGPHAEEAGAEAAWRVLGRDRLPTAVVAANDQAAFGVIETLRAAGVRVPGEVSVAGFDDTPLARFSFLGLTTVDQHPGEMGAAAVDAAIRRRQSPTSVTASIVTPTTLVVRGTTGARR